VNQSRRIEELMNSSNQDFYEKYKLKSLEKKEENVEIKILD
jgi:septin family protein